MSQTIRFARTGCPAPGGWPVLVQHLKQKWAGQSKANPCLLLVSRTGIEPVTY